MASVFQKTLLQAYLNANGFPPIPRDDNQLLIFELRWDASGYSRGFCVDGGMVMGPSLDAVARRDSMAGHVPDLYNDDAHDDPAHRAVVASWSENRDDNPPASWRAVLFL